MKPVKLVVKRKKGGLKEAIKIADALAKGQEPVSVIATPEEFVIYLDKPSKFLRAKTVSQGDVEVTYGDTVELDKDLEDFLSNVDVEVKDDITGKALAVIGVGAFIILLGGLMYAEARRRRTG